MAKPAENKAELESFLDSCTMNFHRFIQRELGTYNGTALGAVSIGWSGFPSGGGAYRGWFDFRTKKKTTLAIKVQGMTIFNKVTFMRAFENGRGHRLLYLPTSKLPKDTGHTYHDSEESWYDKVEPSLEAPIDDKARDYVMEVIKQIKAGEFWTIRKYAIGTGEIKKSRRRGSIEDEKGFEAIVEKTFSDTPSPWPVLRARNARYRIKQIPTDSEPLILEPTDEKDEILSIPQDHLDLGYLNRCGWKVGRAIPNVRLIVTSDKDEDIFSNWTIANLGCQGYIYKGEKSPE